MITFFFPVLSLLVNRLPAKRVTSSLEKYSELMPLMEIFAVLLPSCTVPLATVSLMAMASILSENSVFNSDNISSVIRSSFSTIEFRLAAPNFKPLERVSVVLLVCFRPTVMLLAPISWKESEMELVREELTVMMAITAPIPIIMPSIVRRARILLASSA